MEAFLLSMGNSEACEDQEHPLVSCPTRSKETGYSNVLEHPSVYVDCALLIAQRVTHFKHCIEKSHLFKREILLCLCQRTL